MSEYSVPGDVAELFANGEDSYEIRDPEQSGDNIFAMTLFCEVVGIPEDMIVTDDGTQIIVTDGNKTLCIDSCGLGDFHLHGYSVSEIES